MNIEDIQLGIVRYKVPTIGIIVGSAEPFVLPSSMCSSVVIEKDYENYLFPYFQIEVTVPNWLYSKMTKDPLNIRVNLEMKYGRFSAIDPDPSTPLSTELNGRFYALMIDASPNVYETEDAARQKDNEIYNTGYDLSDAVTTCLILYNEEYFNNSRVMVNEILSSANLTDAIAYVCTKAGINKVLMSPPTNRKTYSEFKLLPLSARDQILHICNYYGIFDTGAILFFDMDVCYIVDKTIGCNCYKTNEYYVTHLVSLSKTYQQSTIAGGCYCNWKEKYNLININPDITILNTGMVETNASGNSFITIDNATGNVSNVSSSVKLSSTAKASPSKAFIISRGDTATASVLKTKMDQSNKILQVSCNRCHMGSLTPNKEYILTLDDPKLIQYNGKYRLSKWSCVFDFEGEFMTMNVVAELRG